MIEPSASGHRTSDRLYGLIGYPLGHSYSKEYFTKKFIEEDISEARYELFPLSELEQFPKLIRRNPALSGLNVTTPYKERIIHYLDELDEVARSIGAVNTIAIESDRLTGYNTDVRGFQMAIQDWMPLQAALILGSGGAAKAAKYGLEDRGVEVTVVSRSPHRGDLTYGVLDERVVLLHDLIVQATPVGQHPHTDAVVPFPFRALTNRHCVIDMIYNPDKTVFLERAEQRGCRIQNGFVMLVEQAEASWNIWTK